MAVLLSLTSLTILTLQQADRTFQSSRRGPHINHIDNASEERFTIGQGRSVSERVGE